jgi:hypothetical protein
MGREVSWWWQACNCVLGFFPHSFLIEIQGIPTKPQVILLSYSDVTDKIRHGITDSEDI